MNDDMIVMRLMGENMVLMRIKNLFKKELVCDYSNRSYFEQILFKLPAIQKELNSSTITTHHSVHDQFLKILKLF